VTLAVGWGVSLVVLLLTLSLLAQPAPQSVTLVLLAVSFVALGSMGYVQLRLRADGLLLSRYLAAKGFPVGDPDGPARTVDRLEVEALRRLRRGRISRGDYERVVAHRRFVHGEISRAEYQSVLAEIANGEAIEAMDSRRAAGTTAGPP
jgi:hypothetical protein